MTSKSLAAALGLWLIFLLSSCATQSSAKRSSSGQLPAALSFDRSAGRGDGIFVILRTEQGEELLFNVDTGCPYTVLDRSLEPQLGKRIGKTRIRWIFQKPVPTYIYRSPKLYSADVQLLMGPKVLTDDVRSHFPDRPVKGILGMDCLANYCVQLDFNSGEMRFLDNAALAPAELGTALPLTIQHYALTRFGAIRFIGGKGAAAYANMDFFHDRRLRTSVDTGLLGNVDMAMEPKIFRHVLKTDRPDWIQGITNASITRAAGFLEAPSELGTIRRLVCGELSKKQGLFQVSVGSLFLGRYLTTFDFPNNTLYLKPTDTSAPAPDITRISAHQSDPVSTPSTPDKNQKTPPPAR